MAEDDTTTEEGVTPPADGPGSSEAPAATDDDTTRGPSTEDATPGGADATQAEPAGEAGQTEKGAEPVERLTPKERRARARAAKAARRAPSGPRTPEERQADRDARRAAAAKARRAGREKARTAYKAEAHNRTATPPREHVAGVQKVRQGVVVSDKADKTITVRIDVARRHRRYEKIVRTSQTLHAHDEANDAHIGDTVTVRECRPLSRSKRWRLVNVVERAK
jgi:small subunit ribosomal protein S17